MISFHLYSPANPDPLGYNETASIGWPIVLRRPSERVLAVACSQARAHHGPHPGLADRRAHGRADRSETAPPLESIASQKLALAHDSALKPT